MALVAFALGGLDLNGLGLGGVILNGIGLGGLGLGIGSRGPCGRP